MIYCTSLSLTDFVTILSHKSLIWQMVSEIGHVASCCIRTL